MRRNSKPTGVAMLITELGCPFTVTEYGNWMGDAIRAAGLPERCVLHGLRKAAARRLAESSCTTKEIASITGHKSLAEVERYTREADQERLPRGAIAKQVRVLLWQTRRNRLPILRKSVGPAVSYASRWRTRKDSNL